MPELSKLHQLAVACYEGRKEARQAMATIVKERKDLKEKMSKEGPDNKTLLETDQKLLSLMGVSSRRGRGGAGQSPSFGSVESSLGAISNILHETDMPPTSQAVAAAQSALAQLKQLTDQHNQLLSVLSAAKK